MSLRFHPEAAREFVRAVQYYEERSPGLGAELLAEFERIEGVLLASPDVGVRGNSDTRRFLLSRFPFVVVYRVSGGLPVIVAFAHQRRRPGYWLDRF